MWCSFMTGVGMNFKPLVSKLLCSVVSYVSERFLRWLDTVFQGQYLPSVSVNYVAIYKDLEKLTAQLS